MTVSIYICWAECQEKRHKICYSATAEKCYSYLYTKFISLSNHEYWVITIITCTHVISTDNKIQRATNNDLSSIYVCKYGTNITIYTNILYTKLKLNPWHKRKQNERQCVQQNYQYCLHMKQITKTLILTNNKHTITTRCWVTYASVTLMLLTNKQIFRYRHPDA